MANRGARWHLHYATNLSFLVALRYGQSASGVSTIRASTRPWASSPSTLQLSGDALDCGPVLRDQALGFRGRTVVNLSGDVVFLTGEPHYVGNDAPEVPPVNAPLLAPSVFGLKAEAEQPQLGAGSGARDDGVDPQGREFDARAGVRI